MGTLLRASCRAKELRERPRQVRGGGEAGVYGDGLQACQR